MDPTKDEGEWFDSEFESADEDKKLSSWLKSAGFSFDPFSQLEASSDPNLGLYHVGHESFIAAWRPWPTVVFAPVGGGKTALLARVVQACWIGQETNRPFPIHYHPPFLKWRTANPTFSEQILAMAQTGASQLLLALAHRPHWFLRLDPAQQRKVRQVLDTSLPGPLDSYLEPILETGSLDALRSLFAPAFLPPDTPDPAEFLQFCQALQLTPASSIPASSSEQWDCLLEVLLSVLHLQSVYLLIDGLDSIPETTDNPAAETEILCDLLPHLSEWADRRIFLKIFIPVDSRALFFERFPALSGLAETVTLEWNRGLLAEVIRRRVYVASGGNYGSFDLLTTPALRDVEMLLARNAVPLPREILVLTRRLLVEHVTNHVHSPKITAEEVGAAIEWYRQTVPFQLKGFVS